MILFSILVFLVLLFLVALRFPWKLNREERELIAKYGLIHFTEPQNVDSIIQTGLDGHKSNLGYDRFMGEIVWMHLITNKDEYYRKKDSLVKTTPGQSLEGRYSACVHLSDFSKSQLARMRIRRFPFHWGAIGDNAVIYQGQKLLPGKIVKFDLPMLDTIE